MKKWIQTLIRSDRPAEILRVNGITVRIYWYRTPSETELKAERLRYLPPSLPAGTVIAVIDDGSQIFWEVFDSRQHAVSTILM